MRPCRIWSGAVTSAGYGKTMVGERQELAHRAAWERENSPIPSGLVIDHLCRNKLCHEVTHLEAVTQRENVLRGDGPRVTRERHASRTHCKHGHEFTPENTKMRKDGRRCRACENRRTREWQARNQH